MANDFFANASPSPQPSAEGEGAIQLVFGAPLAEQLRPRTLAEVIGQEHLRTSGEHPGTDQG